MGVVGGKEGLGGGSKKMGSSEILEAKMDRSLSVGIRSSIYAKILAELNV